MQVVPESCCGQQCEGNLAACVDLLSCRGATGLQIAAQLCLRFCLEWNDESLNKASRMSDSLPVYNRAQTYLWNYEHAPDVTDADVPAVPGEWSFCGLPVPSPLGVPAGPLLNGRWLLYYASLGFDVLTYKTVRSVSRECYPLPNLQPVTTDALMSDRMTVPAAGVMTGSWAVAFGMPSMDPDVWRRDIEWTRSQLPAGKVLSVSVVGTIQDGWSLDDLARDYARCAEWAVQSGAQVIEANFSCPNVSTCDGQLYQQPRDAAVTAAAIRSAIGTVPLVVKLGHVSRIEEATALLESLGPYATAFAMTNSVAAFVRAADGTMLFDGQPRGICGAATLEASITQTELFARLIEQSGASTPGLIGVGGVQCLEDVRRYLAAGATAIHVATAAMNDPLIAIRIRRAWSGSE